jgi:hypothetical protein
MVDFVSNWRVSLVAAVATGSMFWAVFVVPGGPPWAGFVWLSALAVLLLATPMLFLASPASMSAVIHGVEAEPKAGDAVRVTAGNPSAR